MLAIDILRQKFKRVLYIDIDVHHGDGVEYAFENTRSVTTLSFHLKEVGFFPGSGALANVGDKSTTINVPLRRGLSSKLFLECFKTVCDATIAKIGTDAIVMQCGSDSLSLDPLGGWNLDSYAIGLAVEHILSHNIPILLLGGGGYVPSNAARAWAYSTSIACNVKISSDIPEHDTYLDYSPDYCLQTETIRQKDENMIDGYIDQITERVLKHIANIK